MSNKKVFGRDWKIKYEEPFKIIVVPVYLQWSVTIMEKQSHNLEV